MVIRQWLHWAPWILVGLTVGGAGAVWIASAEITAQREAFACVSEKNTTLVMMAGARKYARGGVPVKVGHVVIGAVGISSTPGASTLTNNAPWPRWTSSWTH